MKDIHIGKLIEAQFKKSPHTLAEFCGQLQITPQACKAIFKRKSIKTDRLEQIGQFLNYDFFAIYSTALQPVLAKKARR